MYHGNWLNVSLLGNSHVLLGILPLISLTVIYVYFYWKFITCFSTRKFAYLLRILPQISLLWYTVYYHGNSLNVTVLIGEYAYYLENMSTDLPYSWIMCLLSWKLNKCLLYLEIRISSRNSSNWFPYCDLPILSWKLTTCFSTGKVAYLLWILQHISLLCYTYIIIEIDYMFLYLKYAYLLGILPPISLLWYTYIIMEINYMFLYLEIRISSWNPSTDFPTVIYL